MFRIAEDPSSGSLVQYLAKNCKNDSIVSVGMDKVCVMAAYSDKNDSMVSINMDKVGVMVAYSDCKKLYKAV